MSYLPVVARKRTARRGRRGAGGYYKRGSLWIRSETFISGPLVAGAITGVNLAPDAQLDPGARIGSTVTRIRLSVQFIVDTVGFTTDPAKHRIWVGVIVAPNTLQVGQVPGPHSYGQYDWMMWEAVMPVVGAGSVPASGTLMRSAQYDVKSQRRLHDQHDVPWFVVECDQTSAMPTSFHVVSSVLIKRAR